MMNAILHNQKTPISHRLSLLPSVVYWVVLLVCGLLPLAASATHIRAGEISMERLCNQGDRTYRITVTLYRDVSGVDAQPGFINPLEGTNFDPIQVNPQSLGFTLDGQTEILRYSIVHSYGSSGRFKVSYYEENRNPGVENITGQASEFVPFYIESEFFVNPSLGCNKPPKLLVLPLDRGCVGQRFIHNPGAFDEEGDSLAYRLVDVKSSTGQTVPGFRNLDNYADFDEFGNTPGSFSFNPATGDMIWDAPSQPGQYNVAFVVEEWRNGLLLSETNRDMQVIISDCDNQRPEILLPADTCVVAGSLIREPIFARDPDNDRLNLGIATIDLDNETRGGIFDLTPPRNAATFSNVVGRGLISSVFEWQTVCEDVQVQPYSVTFRAQDDIAENQFELVDLQTLNIQIIGPAPDTLMADFDEVDIGAGVTLSWNPYKCANAQRMTVWRRIGTFDFEPGYCETGLPEYTGYERIGDVAIGSERFTDVAVERGKTYCYRIYAEFPAPGGGEGIASMEVCAFFPQVAPYLLNVDITETDAANGEIDLRWSTPKDVDPQTFPRPWTYQLLRSSQFSPGADEELLAPIFDETDTTFTDTGLNTEGQPYNYRVVFRSGGTPVDTSQAASSVRLAATGSAKSILLNWQAETPWANTSTDYPFHYIYRAPLGTSDNFEFIDSVDVTVSGMTYLDDGSHNGIPLEEDDEYCYIVQTAGTYNYDSLPEPLLNRSQFACAVVTDTTPPCPPVLSILALECSDLGISQDPEADCGQPQDCTGITYQNQLSWTLQDGEGCDNSDVVSYTLYELPFAQSSVTLLDSGLISTQYTHTDLLSVQRCYYITATDDYGNESRPSNIVCNQDCPYYLLPNIFTPNNDGRNDLLVPCKCPRFVRSVDFKVFNRWGKEVYQQNNDIYLRWDGKTSDGQQLAPGTYYYLADVTYESGSEEQIKGWINIHGEGNNGQ